MIGLLVWKKPDGARVPPQERMILHTRFLTAEVARGAYTPRWLLRRRVRLAARSFLRCGVEEIILPSDFSFWKQLGILHPLSTLPLRCAVAAEWVRAALAGRGLTDARVAVCSQRLSREVIRTVTELALHYRYVSLDTPCGGETLCRMLRREYGVSLLLDPAQIPAAEALVLFEANETVTPINPVVLRLYDETQPMPPLVLPPALEKEIPFGIARERFLAALLRSGALRRDQISIRPP